MDPRYILKVESTRFAVEFSVENERKGGVGIIPRFGASAIWMHSVVIN